MAEHWSCKPGVESSILSGGMGKINFTKFKNFLQVTNKTKITGKIIHKISPSIFGRKYLRIEKLT